MIKRIMALLIVLCSFITSAAFAQPDYLTRGEVADYLLEAADFYNPGLERSDIIKGYSDGLLHEDWSVTRAEALVMLNRAYGTLPKPEGHNKRTALKAEEFDDVPLWAKSELEAVFESGIIAGTAKNKFSPDDNITATQLELFVKRVYALYGENPADDFYAAINKENLEQMKIPYGEYITGTLYELQSNSATQIHDIIYEAVRGKNTPGTPQQKIADLYECFVDTNSMDKTSVSPIKSYIDEIDEVKNIGELSLVQEKLSQDLCVNTFIDFALTADMEDSSKYILGFSVFTPFMNKEFYSEEKDASYDAYINYLETLLTVSGEDKNTAKENALKFFELEKKLAENMLSAQEYYDIEKINNVYKFNKLETMFPDFNFDKILESMYLTKDDKVIVFDTALMKDFSKVYNQSNIDVLKTVAKISLLDMWGAELDTRIYDAAAALEKTVFGVEGSYTRSQNAEIMIKNIMTDYLGKMYVEKYFDEQSKQDVLSIAYDIKEAFKNRIKNLSWMSEATKKKAVSKLDAMQIMIGYPDRFDSFMDSVDITSVKNGGTLFSNMLAITKASVKSLGTLQFVERDTATWQIETYTVNAGYDVTSNCIVFPAAILQKPLYDKDASYEENLGGIGYIIAHEMTHAFDSNGALFDENGNICDWWMPEDYSKFEKLCKKVVNFYHGYEAIPAMPINGELTLCENVADMGAAACITELLGKREDADYKKLFAAMAKTFVSTCTREYAKYAMQNDPHADGKARINCVVVHLDEFYDAYDVKEGDGMYVPPEKRIKIW